MVVALSWWITHSSSTPHMFAVLPGAWCALASNELRLLGLAEIIDPTAGAANVPR